VLSRVLTSGGSLLLLPGEGGTGFESLEIPDRGGVADAVIGAHVLLIRR
jgi:hypothetical protein